MTFAREEREWYAIDRGAANEISLTVPDRTSRNVIDARRGGLSETAPAEPD